MISVLKECAYYADSKPKGLGRRSMSVKGWGMLLALLCSCASARVWMSRLDQAQWQLVSDHENCTLMQDVEGFGRLSFVQRAGQPLRYELHSDQALVAADRVYTRSEAPAWQRAMETHSSEQVMLSPDAYHRILVGAAAEQGLAALQAGLQWRVSLPGEQAASWWDVIASPVRFQQAWAGFMHCRAALPEFIAPPPPPPAPRQVKRHVAPAPAHHRIASASQDWLRLHESGNIAIGRGKNKAALSGLVTMSFLAGKNTISKDVQDRLEALVQEWEIRRGEGRTMSLLVEENATPATATLARERLDALHTYLLKRGLDPLRVHMRLDMKKSTDLDLVTVKIGD